MSVRWPCLRVGADEIRNQMRKGCRLHETRLIRSLEDLHLIATHCERVVTLFSGGLDSSHLLKRLAGNRCKVTALAVDLGGGVDRERLAAIADSLGASLHVVDAQEEFARTAVRSAIRANARYMGMYPISASLSRPLIAKCAMDLAAKLGAEAIVHTANQSQNSLRRLNGAIWQLGFDGYFGTPYEYSAISREDKQAELGHHGVPPVRAENVSGDANLWCREFESGNLDNPEGFSVPEHLLQWTTQKVGDGAQGVAISFERGEAVALDDVPMSLVSLIETLNFRAGAHSIGRFSGLEHLENGEKVLEVREAPAAQLLMEAYRHIETATLDAETLREKLSIEQTWVREAVEGRWYGDLRMACEAFIASTAARVTGRVEFKLRTGVSEVCSITAHEPKYLTDRDEWEKLAAASRSCRHLSVRHRTQGHDLRPPVLAEC